MYIFTSDENYENFDKICVYELKTYFFWKAWDHTILPIPEFGFIISVECKETHNPKEKSRRGRAEEDIACKKFKSACDSKGSLSYYTFIQRQFCKGRWPNL